MHNKSINNSKKYLIKNTGCCKAVSDAWVPSYPSVCEDASTNKIFSYSLNSSSDDMLSLDSSSLVVLQTNDTFRILNRFIEIEDL